MPVDREIRQRRGPAAFGVRRQRQARDRLGQVLETSDKAIATGFLPAAPLPGACGICDYKTICGPYEERRTKRKPKDRLEDLTTLRGLP